MNALEQWIFKHNTRLGSMTHSIQTIAQENHNLAQQKKNHGYLKEKPYIFSILKETLEVSRMNRRMNNSN